MGHVLSQREVQHEVRGDARTKVSLAAKTPPSNGVSFGPIIKASQVKKSDSEIGPTALCNSAVSAS